MRISVITPTCDRPVAFRLCEDWMRRQTRPPDQWVVADGGSRPVACSLGQDHLIESRPPGPANFAANLLNGVGAATGELIVFVEDDDWYAPTHIESLERLAEAGRKIIGAEPIQNYYNVKLRCWKRMQNRGASLCQTAFRRELIPVFRSAVSACLDKKTFGVDGALWSTMPRSLWSFTNERTVVGTKGLPGLKGLGVGHRPDHTWTSDPKLEMLRNWIGADADRYREFVGRNVGNDAAQMQFVQ